MKILLNKNEFEKAILEISKTLKELIYLKQKQKYGFLVEI